MTTCALCGHESTTAFKFCPECGAPVEPAAAHREVRKVVTIVFCDLTGSTALGDRTDPETLRATMRGYYDEMRTILERHGGTVEKFIGDAVMALFGAPVVHDAVDEQPGGAGAPQARGVAAGQRQPGQPGGGLLDDPELIRRYGEEIPVTLVDGRQHDFWRVDPARLRAALGG